MMTIISNAHHVHSLTRSGGKLLFQQIMRSQIGHCFSNLNNVMINMIKMVNLINMIRPINMINMVKIIHLKNLLTW